MMKKIDFQNLLDGKAKVLGKEDLKHILGAAEGYDSLGNSDPGDECLTATCVNDSSCESLPYCTKCVGATSQEEGSCASWR
ncbi:hypothetical protein [Ascidiimonas sp. W6]|uniref:hypothetical protein n=1 Tax=Ascidiimonas meishanensis TaxID=3128903 RepID=UPI0030EC1E1C